MENKYDYYALSRQNYNGRRHYTIDGNVLAPSVTNVLNHGKDFQWLDRWREKIGRAEADRISNESREIGTHAHLHLENYINGTPRPTADTEFNLKCAAMADAIISNGLTNVNQFYGVEVYLHYNDLYAGQSDAVGEHLGIPSIIDYKTTRKMKTPSQVIDYFQQGCAYAIAHNKMFSTTINKVVIMMSDHEANYREFIIQDETFDKYAQLWAVQLRSYWDAVKGKGV